MICPPGFFCQKGVKTLCSGGYCPAGVKEPVPCPDGFYDNGARQLSTKDECAYCPVGVYCKDGKVQDKCSAGYYCDFGAAEKGQGSK
jgi:hypothetical protein